jgi:acetolactate synthase-1/2/3 large subunit
MLPKAYKEAISGRPGPVWLDIPIDIQQSTLQINIPHVSPSIKNPPSEKLIKACRKIIAKLQHSHRPLILGGTGVRLSGINNRLIALIEKYGIPMSTAWTHDIIASDHPLFAGRPGTIGTRAGNFCLQASDFLLVLGSRLNVRQTSYNWDSFAKNAWLAHVDIDVAELNKPSIKSDLAVEADLKDFFEVFEQELAKSKLPNFSNWISWCQSIKLQYSVMAEHKQVSGAPLNPYVMVDRIFKNLRDDDIVVCGNASACILPFQVGTLKMNQRLFSNSGSASMGYDLPAALGAATAANIDRKQRIICFAGDGSLQMNIQELQTLKTTGLNVVVVILNNGGYLSIWQTHENFFGRVIGATPASGVEFPDYAAVARAYRLNAATIVNEAELPQLDQLLLNDGPIIIDLHVDPRQEFTPRIKSRVDEGGKFVTPELDDMHPFIEEKDLSTTRQSANQIRSSS